MTDAELLTAAIAERHPDPFRPRDEAAARPRAAGRSGAVVELMRLAAALGDRNGHTGIFPFDEHPATLHAYPMLTYELADGVFVVAAAQPELVGLELLEVAGVPVDELLRELEPLVPRDNAWTVLDRRPQFLATAEVLHGLGVVDELGPVELVLRGRAGSVRAALEPAPARELSPLERSARPWSAEALVGGRAVYVGYDVTRGDAAPFAAEVAALANQAATELVVLDLRRNGGGDNRTYGPLRAALEQAADRGRRLAVLIGRSTFSAAMQLVVDLERRTPATFVGEPTGGSPNHYGDAEPVLLPESGLRAHVATRAWTTAGEGDDRLAREPDVHVALDSHACFSGRDPVLETALAFSDT